MADSVVSDHIESYSRGVFRIYDNIFELKCPNGKLITGDLSEELSRKYKLVYSEYFIAEIGTTEILSEEVGDTYIVYRLLDLIV